MIIISPQDQESIAQGDFGSVLPHVNRSVAIRAGLHNKKYHGCEISFLSVLSAVLMTSGHFLNQDNSPYHIGCYVFGSFSSLITIGLITYDIINNNCNKHRIEDGSIVEIGINSSSETANIHNSNQQPPSRQVMGQSFSALVHSQIEGQF